MFFGPILKFQHIFWGILSKGFIYHLGVQTPRFRSHRIHHGSHRHGGIRHQGDRRPRATTTQSGLKVFEVLTQRSDLPQILICFHLEHIPKNLGHVLKKSYTYIPILRNPQSYSGNGFGFWDILRAYTYIFKNKYTRNPHDMTLVLTGKDLDLVFRQTEGHMGSR